MKKHNIKCQGLMIVQLIKARDKSADKIKVHIFLISMA